MIKDLAAEWFHVNYNCSCCLHDSPIFFTISLKSKVHAKGERNETYNNKAI